MSAPQPIVLDLSAFEGRIHKQAVKSLEKEELKSKSHAAKLLLIQVQKGRAKLSKADIAVIVGMTPQTVHAVQRLNELEIDFRGMQKEETEKRKAERAKVKAEEKKIRDKERAEAKKAKEKEKAEAEKAKKAEGKKKAPTKTKKKAAPKKTKKPAETPTESPEAPAGESNAPESEA